jgi:hypothetical protein
MKLINQHFDECSFCGCKYPPQWQPIMHNGKRYCSNKCIHFDELNLIDEDRPGITCHGTKPAQG